VSHVHPALQLAEPRRRPTRADVLITLVFLVWGLLEAQLENPGGSGPAGLLAAGGYALPLLWRRRFPLLVLLAIGAVTVAYAFTVDVADKGAMPFPALLVAIFSVGLYVERLWLSLLGAAYPIVLLAVLSGSPEWRGERQVVDYAIFSFFICGAWLAGHLIRRRALQVRAAEAAGGAQARAAVRDERTRIARELHDIVAHSVSIIALQAGAAEALVERDPQTAREHMATVRRAAHEALGEMRRLLDVLREDEPEYAPQPQLASIGELVATTREAGQEIELDEQGALDAVPAGVALSAYRIVQEALTNVRKHAGNVPTRVSVRSDGRRLDVEIVNAAGGLATDVNGGGHGLVGMRERARLYGGSVDVGREADGGFAVRATLPLEEPAE
jgi:signal transduction histidine kinase